MNEAAEEKSDRIGPAEAEARFPPDADGARSRFRDIRSNTDHRSDAPPAHTEEDERSLGRAVFGTSDAKRSGTSSLGILV